MKLARIYNDGRLAIKGELIEKVKEEPLLYFNGVSQAVTIANTNNRLQPTPQTTWELWFKIDLTNHRQYDCLMGFANNNWDIRMDSDKYFTCHWYGADNSWGSTTGVSSPYSLWDEEWHHLAIIWDGVNGVARTYVDGVLRNNRAIPKQNPRDMSGQTHFSIGGCNNGNSRKMCGNIKEVRIWNTARTEEEIVDNMNNKLTGDEEGLTLYLPLNEGKGKIVMDRASGYETNLNGTIWQGDSKNIILTNNGNLEVYGEYIEGNKNSIQNGRLELIDIIEGDV